MSRIAEAAQRGRNAVVDGTSLTRSWTGARADGAVAYRGPALSYESLSGNYAGEGTAHGRLLGCPGAATVTGQGLSASGRC